MELASAQDQLDSAGPNTRVSLAAGDYGPLVIDRPLTLDCNGASVWAHSTAPSIRVRSLDVVVENAVLRAWDKPADGSWPLVLEIDVKAGAHFRNVKLAGSVRGNGSESGPWIIPREIELDVIETTEAYFTLDFAVPVPCRLVSRVQGIDFDPPALAPGINKVRLKVADMGRDTILWGTVELSSDQFVRLLPLHGRVAVQHPGAVGATRHLHTLSKEQEAAFNHALHPAPAPVAKPPRGTLPPEKPPVKLPPEPAGSPAAASRNVPEPVATAPRKILPVLTVTRRAEEVVVVDAKNSKLSRIFSQPEPELPTLVVQPEISAAVAGSELFQPETARELKPDETVKPEQPPAKAERLISKLFTDDGDK